MTTTYNPWQLFDALGREAAMHQRKARRADEAWSPAVDINELDESYLIAMDIPGVSTDSIDISAEKRVLKVSGNRSPTVSSETEKFVRRERVSGDFSRSFQLPDNANLSKITAKYDNGVLAISVPKQDEEKAIKIEVQH